MSEDVQETGLVALDQRVVMPAASATEAKKAWREYEELKASILDPDHDIQVIGKQEFKKKSYWKKVSTFFNLNVTVLSEDKKTGATGDLMDFNYHFTVRATAPNGRYVDAVGSCSSYEKAKWVDGQWMEEEKKWNGKYMAPTGNYTPAQPNNEHNTRSTAYTRASNRAISDLVGGGEVSAEEVSQRDRGHDYEDDEPAPPPAKRTPTRKAGTNGEVVKNGERYANIETGEIVEPDVFAVAAEDNAPSDDEVATLYETAEQLGYGETQIEAMTQAKFKARPDALSREQYTAVMRGLSEAVKKASK